MLSKSQSIYNSIISNGVHLPSTARTAKRASRIFDFRFLIADLDLPRGSFIPLTIHPVREYKV